jgi:formylglycine-generating enzyme
MKKIKLTMLCILCSGVFFSCQTKDNIQVEGGTLKLDAKELEIGSFIISKYETTNKEYAEFLNDRKVGADGVLDGLQIINISSQDLQVEYANQKWSVKEGKNNCPMVMVSYFGAVEYAKWDGGNLPTVPEWIFAAMGGNKSQNYIYAGGNDLNEVGWYRENCDGRSHNVGEKKPNELGIYDMSGNAWEWCLNDSLKSASDFCLHMGGSWFPGEKESRIESRFGNTPDHFSNSVGFRVIFPVKKES